MKKFLKVAILLTSSVCATTLVPVLASCNKGPKITKLDAYVNFEYFVGEQIKKEDFVVTATWSDGTSKKVTDWTCDVQLPYTFEDTEQHTFTISYGGFQTKVIKQGQERYGKISIKFISGGHGTIEKSEMSIQAPVKWSAVIKPIVYPDSGYEFDKWVDENNVEISKDKVLRFDCTVKALFKEQPEGEKGLKFVHQHLVSTGDFFLVEWDGSDSISEELHIPSSHYYPALEQNLPVLWVSHFKNCKYIKKVYIPSCVTKIDSEAFAYDSQDYYSQLTEVIFESGSQCEEIYSSAFKGCQALAEITIPKSVTKIGENAFDMSQYQNPALNKVEFESGSKLKTISQDTFKGCTQLTSIELPDGLTTLGGFNGTSINTINIPDSVTQITDKCFYTEKLTGVIFAANSKLSLIGDSAFKTSQITKITIPDTVTKIGAHAFENCSKLGTVTIGENSKLTNIGSGGGKVFSGTKVAELVIPATVTTLGASLFGDTTDEIELTSLIFKDAISSWKVGYSSEPATYTPTGVPGDDAASFVVANNGCEMNKNV